MKHNQYKLEFSKQKINWDVKKEDLNTLLAKSQKQWRNKDYWALPENIREIVDLNAVRRGEHRTDFYNKLQNLNDKINVYKAAFY